MKSYAFLFWGYLVVWLGLAAYFVVLMRRVSRVARRLDALESRSKETGGKSAT
jgi:CcmD family protein